jgi:hypothetical protein
MNDISDDGDDFSSLGDASPMNEAQTLQRRRQQRVRMRLGSIMCFLAIYVLLSSSLASNPKIMYGRSDDIHSVQNKTILTQLRQTHVHQVASTIARVYSPASPSVWCIDGRLKMEQSKRRPMGLSYLKIPRAASSTLAGINQRIARNFAKRQNLEMCIRHDGQVPGMYYTKRDALSFLWTFLRDPADRAMSRVAASLAKQQGNANNSTVGNSSSFVLQALQSANDVQYGTISEGRGGFQLQYSMLTIIDEYSAWNKSDPTQIINPRHIQRHVQQVINGYDFIGVTERFDESLVALQLLLGLETSDILYFASRTSSQYERRPVRNKQKDFFCQRPLDPQFILTPPVRDYFHSSEWFAQNYGDYMLYQAANQSLDMTIWRLGLDVFAKALKDFRSLSQKARETCRPLFPCSFNGTYQYEASQKDCYSGDIGCGFSCLNTLTEPKNVDNP